MGNKNHVITSHNVEQEVLKSVQCDVVIPNKLSNSETCQGLRHWRLLSNLKNNFSKTVRNDMDNKILNQLTATPTHTDSHVSPQLNCSLCKVQDDVTGSLAPSGTLVEPTNEVELSETACRMAEWLGRGGNSLQNDATTCAPLVGTLISKGGKNALDCNQEPSLEFVSDKNRLDCFALARNDEMVKFEDNGGTKILKQVQDDNIMRHPEGDNPKDLSTLGSRFFAHSSRGCKAEPYPFNARVAQNDAINKNVKTLVPECPSALMPTVVDRLIDFKKKIAFTLAETLITLGIIGIVAAMTIPTLLSNFTKQKLEEQIKVTYSSIQQTIKFMDDDGLAFSAFQDGSDAAMKEWFDMYLAQHMKTESVCINAPGCWHKYGVAKDLKGNLNVWDRSNNIGWGRNIITFTTAKGAWFDMDGHAAGACRGTFGINTDDKCLVIYFDANGDRKPNRIGKDIHIVVWTEDGLVPAGSDKTTAEVKQNCTKGNGYWCLQEIINDSWKIPDSVWKR